MDHWLSNLPEDGPSRDLVARINLTVAHRERLRARWRRGAVAAGTVGLIGAVLVSVSWISTGALPALPDPSALLDAAGGFLSSPLNAVGGSAQAALAWETSLAEGMQIAFLLGAVLLTLGSAGGLVRLLGGGGSMNGYSR
jgi:hypothetical protein